MAIAWEKLESVDSITLKNLYRAKVPEGWIVAIRSSGGQSITFVPDPNHEWDGSSLP